MHKKCGILLFVQWIPLSVISQHCCNL